MAVYILVPIAQNFDALATAINAKVDEHDRYELPHRSGWLVVFKGTTVEVCNFLEITGQVEGARSPIGAVFVVPITSYYGRGTADMWEWVKLRMEAGQ